MLKNLILILLLAAGCSMESVSSLPVKSTLPDVTLKDFDGNEFVFSKLKGKVIVLSYIYTNCPDICHITSSKINKFKESLNEKTKEQVYVVSISFDPDRDSPEVLRKHARMMNLNLDNWIFLTGNKEEITKVLAAAGIDPWMEKGQNSESYTFSHRDRISLVDQSGQIRMHYKGTNFDEEKLSSDIRSLL